MVFKNRTPGYKEEESLLMGRWSTLQHAAEVLGSFDPEAGSPDSLQMSLIFNVVELAAGEPWPLESMTREQAFSALARGLGRMEQKDGRAVMRLLFEDVRAMLVQSEQAFAAGNAQLGYELLLRARDDLNGVMRDLGPAP
jgi:hypothetical protein